MDEEDQFDLIDQLRLPGSVVVIDRGRPGADAEPDDVSVMIVQNDQILVATSSGMNFEVTAYNDGDELETVRPLVMPPLDPNTVSIVHPGHPSGDDVS